MHDRGYFSIPSSWAPCDLERRDEKAVIISVFGQSPTDSNGYKISILELMLGRNVFRKNVIQRVIVNEAQLTGIDGYYDPDRRIVFLHLNGYLDSTLLLKTLQKLSNELQEKGFLVVWSNLRFQYARSLLLLFCMSHIVLLCHPNHIFDITYIHLFRTLEIVRNKFQHLSSSVLKGVDGITKDWITNGRLCPPRVLFLFSSHLIPLHILNSEVIRSGSSSHPLRKLELDLECQIYHLLRKSRVITNISFNSLFALPNNQPFVYVIETNHEMLSDRMSKTLDEMCHPVSSLSLNMSQLLVGESGSSKSLAEFGYQDASDVTLLSEPIVADSLGLSLLSGFSSERTKNLEHSFNHFLKRHIDEALTKGFDDSVGRHTIPVCFEVPKVSVWFEAFHVLYKYLMEDMLETDDKDKQILSALRSNVETDIRFSDVRCAKVLPIAVSTYKDGLPSHYTKAHHQSKLDVAMGILASQARGPMYEKYERQLEEVCAGIWQDGRVGCETLSFTGNACHHPCHRSSSKEADQSLPVMSHSSGVVYISYCNCGHHQAQLEDPFEAKESNFDYYDKVEDTQCLHLERKSFPTFKSSVVDAKAAELTLHDERPHWPEVVPRTPVESKTDTPQTPLELSVESPGLSQGGSSNPIRIVEGMHDEDEVVFTLHKEEIETDEETDEKEAIERHDHDIDRQVSTTEYLPGMLTTSSPTGLLPQFSSWSLVCLGPSSLYSHNAGICDQPGFLNGTNFLLPWDVTVKIKDKEKWPAIADSLGKKGFMLKNKKNRMGGDLNEFSVKIFLGTEYQCLRGHRFMMASPDRHLKATHLGHVKDTAVRIANADMPLYFPCPCSRSGALVNGQLMRIHVVTPKAPVHVTLNPQVQPAPEPCPKFIPQPMSYSAIKLAASAYYILRLPFVYVGDNGPYYPPRTTTPASYARLVKGTYGISEITLDR